MGVDFRLIKEHRRITPDERTGQCPWCGSYVDLKTGQRTKEKPVGDDISHYTCDICSEEQAAKIMKELREMGNGLV